VHPFKQILPEIMAEECCTGLLPDTVLLTLPHSHNLICCLSLHKTDSGEEPKMQQKPTFQVATSIRFELDAESAFKGNYEFRTMNLDNLSQLNPDIDEMNPSDTPGITYFLMRILTDCLMKPHYGRV
jgi:hypothetical protein